LLFLFLFFDRPLLSFPGLLLLLPFHSLSLVPEPLFFMVTSLSLQRKKFDLIVLPFLDAHDLPQRDFIISVNFLLNIESNRVFHTARTRRKGAR